VRFNGVAPGLLKTSASAGIPGYVDSYLYAEQLTLRKQAVQTEEAAAVALRTISDVLRAGSPIMLVRCVLFSERHLEIYRRALRGLGD